MNFAREHVTTELLHEILPLLASHWKEVAHFQDIPLNPDFQFYQACEHGGILRCYTVREGRELLGYAVFLVRTNPHYQTSLQANQDILYIDPSVRGFMPIRFLKYCNAQLRAEGVQAVYHHVKTAHNFGPILKRLGFEHVDEIYTLRLDKET